MKTGLITLISLAIILLGVYIAYPRPFIDCSSLEGDAFTSCNTVALFECSSNADQIKGVAQKLRYAQDFDASIQALEKVSSCYPETYGADRKNLDHYYWLYSVAYTYEEAKNYPLAIRVYEELLNAYRFTEFMDYINIENIESTIDRLKHS